MSYDSLFANNVKASKPEDHTVDFKKANILFQKHQYSDAFVAYLHLAEKEPRFDTYLTACSSALVKARTNAQYIQPEAFDRYVYLIRENK